MVPSEGINERQLALMIVGLLATRRRKVGLFTTVRGLFHLDSEMVDWERCGDHMSE